jgi:hypothetical protein
MPSFKLLGCLAIAALSLTTVACGSSDSSTDNAGTPSDENDITSGACGPATTLTCKSGYEITTEGCASSRVAGAPVQGRCVKIADPNVCGPATTLTCKAGFEITTEGCASSRVAGAPPQGRCVNVDAAKFEGTWLEDLNSPRLEGSNFYSYTFAADGTFTSRGGCRQDTPGIHCNAISAGSGKWTLDKSGPQLGAPGGASEITLVDSFDQKQTYFYTVTGKKLTLSATFGVGTTPSTWTKQ